MQFKKLSVGRFAYGKSDPTVDRQHLKDIGVTNVEFDDQKLYLHLQDPNHENYY